MTSAIPDAIAWLLVLAEQASASTPGAIAVDSWTNERAAVMFGVGTAAPPFFSADQQSAIQGTPTWAGLGAKHIQEDFSVPCYIYAGAGGIDNAGPRATAFAIWDLFLPLFKADLSLGGALTGGRFAAIGDFQATGPRSPEEAEGGRYCLIQFPVHCQNLT